MRQKAKGVCVCKLGRGANQTSRGGLHSCEPGAMRQQNGPTGRATQALPLKVGHSLRKSCVSSSTCLPTSSKKPGARRTAASESQESRVPGAQWTVCEPTPNKNRPAAMWPPHPFFPQRKHTAPKRFPEVTVSSCQEMATPGQPSELGLRLRRALKILPGRNHSPAA